MISFELLEDEELAEATLETLAADIVRPRAAQNDRVGAIAASVLDAVWSAEIIQSPTDETVMSDEPRDRLRLCLLLEELGRADTARQSWLRRC